MMIIIFLVCFVSFHVMNAHRKLISFALFHSARITQLFIKHTKAANLSRCLVQPVAEWFTSVGFVSNSTRSIQYILVVVGIFRNIRLTDCWIPWNGFLFSIIFSYFLLLLLLLWATRSTHLVFSSPPSVSCSVFINRKNKNLWKKNERKRKIE